MIRLPEPTVFAGEERTYLHSVISTLRNVLNQLTQIKSGRYTPVVTVVLNIDTSTCTNLKWYKTDDMVSVFGEITVDATAAANTELRLNLPLISTLAETKDLAGTITDDAGTTGRIYADIVNNAAYIKFTAASGTSTNYSINFQYEVFN